MNRMAVMPSITAIRQYDVNLYNIISIHEQLCMYNKDIGLNKRHSRSQTFMFLNC